MSMYQTGTTALAASSTTDRALAALAHGGLFYGMPFLAPIVVYVIATMGVPSAYVQRQAAQAALFHLIYTVITGAFVTILIVSFFSSLVATGLAAQFSRWLMVMWPVTLGLGLLAGIFSLWGAVIMAIATFKSISGEPYRMPLVGRIWD